MSLHLEGKLGGLVVKITDETKENLTTVEMFDMFESVWLGLTFSKRQLYKAASEWIEEYELINKNK